MTGMGIFGLVLGIVNFTGIAKVLKGETFLFFRDEKSAVISALVIGLLMCGVGINLMLQNSGIRIAGMITGGLMGLALAVIFFFMLTNQPIPILGTVRNGLIALLVIMAVKLTVSSANMAYLTIKG